MTRRITKHIVQVLAALAVAFAGECRVFAEPEDTKQPPPQPYDYAAPVQTSRYYSVAFIDKSKRLVFINAGEAHGINKGDRVCILDQTRVKIGCFRIRIINKTSAGFKPSKKKFPKINSGMVARFAEDDEQLDEDFEDIKTSYAEFGLVVSGLLPYTFNKVLYEQDEEDSSKLRILKDAPVMTNFTQMYLGSQIQFTATLGYATGLIARIFSPIEYESELGASYPDIIATHEYSAIGVGVPFVIRWFYGKKSTQLILSEGIQWDLSYLKYRLYTQKGDAERELVLKHLSVLNTVSIRAEIGGAYKVGKDSKLTTTLGVIVPVFKFGATNLTEFEGASSGLTSLEVEEAIEHEKAKVGVDLGFSFLLGF